VDKKNVILAGHARFQALLRLKWEEAPVIRLTSLTEEQARRFRIADNKAGELSEWDLDKLKKEVDDLGFESVSVFFDSDQWRSLLSVAEMTAESSADMKEVVGYAPGEAQPAAPEIQLLCPHCLEELAFTKDQLSELVTASKAEAEKS
jgi:ParB-like chromosome segregation protein Spo0J